MRLPSVGRRTEQGASLVEFALVMPLFLLLVFGIMEAGWLFAQLIEASNAAREGGTLAVVDFRDATASRAIETSVLARTLSSGGAVVVISTSGDVSDPIGDPTANVTVEINKAYESLTGFLDPIFDGTPLDSTVTMRNRTPHHPTRERADLGDVPMNTKHPPPIGVRGDPAAVRRCCWSCSSALRRSAVDLTAAYAETRQAQSTADAAVLAAGLEFLDDTSPSNEDLYDAIKQYTALNWEPRLPRTVPTGRHARIRTNLLTSYPSRHSATPAAPIRTESASSGADDLRCCGFACPTTRCPTSFARLLGIRHDRDLGDGDRRIAVIEVQAACFRSRSRPISATGRRNASRHRPPASSRNDPAPCGGPTQGNFGMVDCPWFGAGVHTSLGPVGCADHHELQ